MNPFLKLMTVLLLLTAIYTLPVTAQTSDQPSAAVPKVLVLPISDEKGKFMVDQVQADFLIEHLKKAEAEGYTGVIFKVDTYGGVIFAAREINEQILRMNIPTTVYVETKAISAGVFIAWACTHIAMERLTTIGDAQMIMETPEGIVEAPEKAVTVYRSDWEKASKARNRSFALAQGFFESEVEVLRTGPSYAPQFMTRTDYDKLPEGNRPEILEVVCESGKLLTLHADRAAAYGIASVHENFGAFLASKNLSVDHLHEVEMSTNQTLLRLLGSNPWVFLILTLIGLNGLYMEIKTPGFGVPGLTAFVCFTLVFGSRYFLGSASPLEMVIFCLGLIMCILEIFVIPGFGIFGLGGMALMFGALVLSTIPDFGGWPDHPIQIEWIKGTSLMLCLTFLASLLTLVLLLPLVFKLPGAKRAALQKEMLATDGYVMDTITDRSHMVGMEGVTLGDLHPAGKMKRDDGTLLDVTSQGRFIPAHTRVHVVEVDGNRIIVAQTESHMPPMGTQEVV